VRDVRIVLDLTLLPKAPVVTLKGYSGGLNGQFLRPETRITLDLPDFEAFVGRRGVLCSVDPERSVAFSSVFSDNPQTPNLQKLLDGGSAVVE
jgi:hypothetical protein